MTDTPFSTDNQSTGRDQEDNLVQDEATPMPHGRSSVGDQTEDAKTYSDFFDPDCTEVMPTAQSLSGRKAKSNPQVVPSNMPLPSLDSEDSQSLDFQQEQTQYLDKSVNTDNVKLWMSEDDQLDVTSFPFLIGRGQDCQLRLAGKQVARRHAEIVEHAGRLIIHDLNSAAGVKGFPVKRAILQDQDEILLGDRILIFSLGLDFNDQTHRRLSFLSKKQTLQNLSLGHQGDQLIQNELPTITPDASHVPQMSEQVTSTRVSKITSIEPAQKASSEEDPWIESDFDDVLKQDMNDFELDDKREQQLERKRASQARQKRLRQKRNESFDQSVESAQVTDTDVKSQSFDQDDDDFDHDFFDDKKSKFNLESIQTFFKQKMLPWFEKNHPRKWWQAVLALMLRVKIKVKILQYFLYLLDGYP
jgi:pSer/pThr/pTyr-binding forkhead associated (FHA) protein